MVHFSGFNRNYCYVRYQTAEAAQNAVALLNKTEIRPCRRLQVSISKDNRLLILYGFPSALPAHQVKDELDNYCSGITKVNIINNAKERSTDVMVTFKSHQGWKEL